MIVDSSAIIAIMAEEPEADDFTALVVDHETWISAGNALECLIVVQHRMGTEKLPKLDALFELADIQIAPITEQTLYHARQAHVTYGKGNHRAALNYGDCFAYALSKESGQALLFKGDDFAQTDVSSAYQEAA